MSSSAGSRRKPKTAQHKTSALEAVRASGLAGMFSGAANLASNRKRALKEKLRGKANPPR
jgi:hypothetical protein